MEEDNYSFKDFSLYLSVITALAFSYGVSYNAGFFSPFEKSAMSFIGSDDYLNTALSSLPINMVIAFAIGMVIPTRTPKITIQIPAETSSNEEKISFYERQKDILEERLAKFFSKTYNSILIAVSLIALLSILIVPYKLVIDFLYFLFLIFILTLVVKSYSFKLQNSSMKFKHLLVYIPFMLVFSYGHGLLESMFIIVKEPTNQVYSSSQAIINSGTFLKSVSSGVYIIQDANLIFYSNSGQRIIVSKIETESRIIPCILMDFCYVNIGS